jgi:murein DD-endopeptidase MepM/ murein hydrolase activator NlpD
MIYKTIAIKPIQRLDQSLISIGGWLRSLDTQVIPFVHVQHQDWSAKDAPLHQHQYNSDIPEWTYQYNATTLHQDKSLKGKKWYQNLGKSLSSWHTSFDWRDPLSELSLRHELNGLVAQGSMASVGNGYHSSVSQSSTVNASLNVRPFPSLHFPQGLGQLWATSYQFSTALAVLLPIAVNAVQAPTILNLLTQISLPVQSEKANADAAVKLVVPATSAVVAKAPAQARYSFSKPTGLISNIQSYTLPAKGEFTSGYGMRWGRMHKGIDIAGPIGAPIVAAAAGKVLTAGWAEDGFGNKVEIQHPDGTITLYAHASRVLTRVGAKVRRGQQIAEIGSTGASTGPHLHFQIHPGGKTAIDPLFFFARNSKMLTAAKPDA